MRCRFLMYWSSCLYVYFVQIALRLKYETIYSATSDELTVNVDTVPSWPCFP